MVLQDIPMQMVLSIHLLQIISNVGAALIAEIYRDQGRHRHLRMASRRVFEERLNLDAWGARAATHINELLATRKPQARMPGL